MEGVKGIRGWGENSLDKGTESEVQRSEAWLDGGKTGNLGEVHVIVLSFPKSEGPGSGHGLEEWEICRMCSSSAGLLSSQKDPGEADASFDGS